MNRGIKLAILGIKLAVISIILALVGIFVGIIPLTCKDNVHRISDVEFKYNENLTKLEIRCSVVLVSLLRDLVRLHDQGQDPIVSVKEDVGYYYKEMTAISDVLHSYVTVPSEAYKPSYDGFSGTIGLISDLLINMKGDLQNGKSVLSDYLEEMNNINRQYEISRSYRLRLFSLHYAPLSKDLELLSANLYETDEFEKSVYYMWLLRSIYVEKKDIKKIAIQIII